MQFLHHSKLVVEPNGTIAAYLLKRKNKDK